MKRIRLAMVALVLAAVTLGMLLAGGTDLRPAVAAVNTQNVDVDQLETQLLILKEKYARLQVLAKSVVLRDMLDYNFRVSRQEVMADDFYATAMAEIWDRDRDASRENVAVLNTADEQFQLVRIFVKATYPGNASYPAWALYYLFFQGEWNSQWDRHFKTLDPLPPLSTLEVTKIEDLRHEGGLITHWLQFREGDELQIVPVKEYLLH